MKKLLNLLIVLSLFATTSYYLYKNNEKFNSYISKILNFNKPVSTDDGLNKTTTLGSEIIKKNKKRISKKLKHDIFYRLDKYAKETPKQFEKDIPTLVKYLIEPTSTEIEKVRVLFSWVALHVKYDDKAFNKGVFPDYTANYVLKNKKAVCEGYSNIFHELCIEAGLESEKIIGYAKGYGYQEGDKFRDTDHAWNAVKIDNNWKLFDVTWASGLGISKKGKLFSISKFEPFWFDVNPKVFIFTHLPEQSKWQLLDQPITLNKYESLPYLSESFFQLGFSPDKIYNDAVLRNLKEFVETFSLDFPLKVKSFPHSKNLNRGEEVIFEIESEYAEEIALIDNGNWYYFKKNNFDFNLTHIPKGKNIKICIKINWFDKEYSTITNYIVNDKKSKTNI